MPLSFVAEPDKRLLAAAVRHVSRERFTVLPDGAGFSTELMRTELSWAAIRSTAELPGQVILGLVGGGFVTVPVGGLTEDQHARLRALLNENAGRRATAVLPPVARTAAAAPKTLGVRPPTP